MAAIFQKNKIFLFFFKIGLVSNHLWKKQLYMTLFEWINGLWKWHQKQKNFYGGQFSEKEREIQSLDGYILGMHNRSSNLQDFHFIGHGSQSQIFREIWEGHHGTSRWFDMEWLMSEQLLVIVHSVNEKKYNWKKTFIPSNITVCIFISNGCCPCIFSDLLHSCEVNVASSEYGQSSQETTSLCLIKLSIMVTFFEPQSEQHKNNRDKVSYNCQYLLQD